MHIAAKIEKVDVFESQQKKINAVPFMLYLKMSPVIESSSVTFSKFKLHHDANVSRLHNTLVADYFERSQLWRKIFLNEDLRWENFLMLKSFHVVNE